MVEAGWGVVVPKLAVGTVAAASVIRIRVTAGARHGLHNTVPGQHGDLRGVCVLAGWSRISIRGSRWNGPQGHASNNEPAGGGVHLPDHKTLSITLP